MKKTLIALGVAAIMAASVSCNQNQTAAPAAAAANDSTAVAGSIVYFNMDKVMESYDMANDLNSVFETKTSGIQAELDRRGKKLEKDASDFQNKVDKGLLTTSVAQAQYQKLQQQQQEYQREHYDSCRGAPLPFSAVVYYAAYKGEEVLFKQCLKHLFPPQAPGRLPQGNRRPLPLPWYRTLSACRS